VVGWISGRVKSLCFGLATGVLVLVWIKVDLHYGNDIEMVYEILLP